MPRSASGVVHLIEDEAAKLEHQAEVAVHHLEDEAKRLTSKSIRRLSLPRSDTQAAGSFRLPTAQVEIVQTTQDANSPAVFDARVASGVATRSRGSRLGLRFSLSKRSQSDRRSTLASSSPAALSTPSPPAPTGTPATA